jgi:hypothetical protein
MGDRLLNLSAFRVPASGILALAGRFLAFLAWLMLLVALAALRLVVVFLRLLRPFILAGLFLAIIGGIGMTIGFGYWHHWQDAMQAAFVTLVSSMAFVLYSCLAIKVESHNFDPTPPAWWWRY